MSGNPRALAATFTSHYYQCLMTDASTLTPLYNPRAVFKHHDQKVTGPEAIAKQLQQLYPQRNHGRVVVSDIEIAGGMQFIVKGKFIANGGGALGGAEATNFTQSFELRDNGRAFGIVSDTLSIASQSSGSVPLPPSAPTAIKSWANDTPPLFAKQATGEISPLQKTIPPAAVPPPMPQPLPATAVPVSPQPAAPLTPPTTAVKVEQPKPQPAVTTPKAEPVTPPKSPAKSTPVVTAPAPVAAADVTPPVAADQVPQKEAEPVVVTPSKSAEEAKPTEEKVLTLAERLRLKQGLPAAPPKAAAAAAPAPATKTAEKTEKPKPAVEKKPKQEKPAAPAAAPTEEAKPAEEKPAAETKEATEKKPRPEGKKPSDGPQRSRRPLVYYDMILKGLPEGTTVEELEALLQPHVTLNAPIKLEARAGGEGRTRTFAFVQLDSSVHPSTEETLSTVKRLRLTLPSGKDGKDQPVIFDRVHEKFDK